MSNKEIFICLAVMLFLGYLVGSKIEQYRTMIILDELHKELLNILVEQKSHREQMEKEIDNCLIEHGYEPRYKQKEDSDD